MHCRRSCVLYALWWGVAASVTEGLFSHEMSGGSFKVKGMLRAYPLLTRQKPTNASKRLHAPHTHTHYVISRFRYRGKTTLPQHHFTSAPYHIFSKATPWPSCRCPQHNLTLTSLVVAVRQLSPLCPLSSLKCYCVASVIQKLKLPALCDGIKLNLNDSAGWMYPEVHPLKYVVSTLEVALLWPLKCVIDSKHAIRAPMIGRQSFSETGLPRCQKTVSHQQLNLRGREEGWWDGGKHRGGGLAGGRVPSQACPNSMLRW